MKKIFFDLDETLVYSVFESYSDYQITLENEWYGVKVKPGAIELVKYAQEIFGVENVYLLTAAIHEYAVEINKTCLENVFGKRIISRDFTERHFKKNEVFTSVLYDNLPQGLHNTWKKMEYLSTFSDIKPKFILAHEYSGEENDVFTSDEIQSIVQKFNE